jgi:excisionase family DNA binding protein
MVRLLEALLSQTEARRLLGISRPTLARLIRGGELPVIKVAGRTLIDPVDLRAFIEERRLRRGLPSNDDDPAATGSHVSTPAGAGGGDGEP